MGAIRLIKSVIMGAPGSGKGTISARIVRDFGLKHLSSGDALRSQIMNKTEVGMQAKQYIEKGQLVPDSLITKLLSNEITSLNENWLLDGFPRTRAQAESLGKFSDVNLVINLDVPDEVIIDRIKGRWTHLASGRIYHTEFNPPEKPGVDDITGEPLVQREDDKEEVVRNRLKTYHSITKPVLEFYREQKILEEFHGRESNEIYPRVHTFLTRILPAKSGPF
ncbi:hypothetical protein CHUAL_004802 [Chamberlinius hualienensis]